ncbi:MAG TPA: 5'/3'-nucleotidase SurE [Deinococcales bacterium]|nr:5'/3'-nucleotidase SurE [Deinococcales bacterium]
MSAPRILVANDDGIFSPGLKALALAMTALGEVAVVAPDVEQSAVGHGMTVRRPLRFKHTASAGFGEVPAYRVDGTPADCVILGAKLLKRPTLVVSGINIGYNLGFDLTHSGTVAAAMQGVTLGLPAIAFSMRSGDSELDFGAAAAYAARIARWVLENGLPARTLLNVNFPSGTPRGVRVTTHGTHDYSDAVVKRLDPNGVPYYWLAGTPVGDEDPQTDFAAVHEGFVSVTPILMALTHRGLLERLRGSLPGLE